MEKERKKIVIADDNHDLCRLLKDVLESKGYEVDLVYDGLPLVSYLKDNQDIDGIILDLVMPERGGLSVFNTIRSISPASALIIYTAYSDYGDSVFARAADAFVDKNDGADRLLKALDDVL